MDRGARGYSLWGFDESDMTDTPPHTHIAEFGSNRRGEHTHKMNPQDGTSLVVQWLVLCPSSTRGTSLSPSVGTKISHAAQPKIKLTEQQQKNPQETLFPQTMYKIDSVVVYACICVRIFSFKSPLFNHKQSKVSIEVVF